jgi:hypothetical protein
MELLTARGGVGGGRWIQCQDSKTGWSFSLIFVPWLVRSADSDYHEKSAKHSSTPEMKNVPKFTEILFNIRQFTNCSVDQ